MQPWELEQPDEMGGGGEAPGGASWMVTFTDLVSLMLTFFVLLFAMSSVKVDKWDTMIDALSQTLNPSKVETVAVATARHNISTVFRKRSVNLDYLAVVLEEAMVKNPLLNKSRIMRLEDRLVIALPGDLLFEPAGADLNERAREAMFVLGGLLRNVGNQIGVNGHSDPVPPQTGRFSSNWQLSLARAVSVANTLKQSGYEDGIIPYGFASARFSDLPTDLSDAERRALGRRVDIVILPTVGGA
jgi:chemotaxis protein MotB